MCCWTRSRGGLAARVYTWCMSELPAPIRTPDSPVLFLPTGFGGYEAALHDARRRLGCKDDGVHPEFHAWNATSDYDPALRERMIAAFLDHETNLVAVYVDWQFAYLADHGPDDVGASSFWPDFALSDMPWTTRQLEGRDVRDLVKEVGDGLVLASNKRLCPTQAELEAQIVHLEAELKVLEAAEAADAGGEDVVVPRTP